MYLLRKILHTLGGNHTPVIRDFRFQPLNTQSLTLKLSKWSIAVLLIGIGLFGVSCTSSAPDKNLTEVEEVQPQPIANPSEAASNTIPVKYVVTIKDMKYNPAVTYAHMGDTILFINKDLVAHNIADSLTKEWLSPQLDFGSEWPMVVTKNLHYYCAFHPNMEGDIQVEPSLNAQKSK